MTISRIGCHDRGFAIGLLLLMALAFTACVSAQESENEDASPPPPTTNVMFRSEPGNAEVFINGQFRGTTPVNLHLAAGAHKVELKLDGYRPWERELVVIAGDDTRVAATLQPE